MNDPYSKSLKSMNLLTCFTPKKTIKNYHRSN